MLREQTLKGLGLGIHSIPRDPELIPPQSSQDSLGWISLDGEIELTRGRVLMGAEETSSSYVQGEGWGYKVDGTPVHFRKTDTKIQYYNTSSGAWVDVVTGLTNGQEYTFSAYQSLAGTFIYATGYDGIYKIHTANPASYTSLYDSTKNHKGRSMITESRMTMWNVKGSLTTLFQSHTDAQDSTTYTNVTGEVVAAVEAGTLAFKAGGATRTCFNVKITDTDSGEVFTDNYDGTLTGSAGHTGTINYTSGAFTISGQAGAGTAEYSWENTNSNGVTDFTYSAPRTAIEGAVFRQDEGGDAIENVLLHEGSYYSIKSNSVYKLTWATDGLNATNTLFRKNIGLQYWRSATQTGKGIIFMDTANLVNPKLTILQKNIYGDNLEPYALAEHFDFSDYYWDMCDLATHGEYIMFSGRTKDSSINNRLFVYNVRKNTVDLLPYGAKTITSNGGDLYIGDVSTFNIYKILNGFDDDNTTIENYWISNDELFGTEYLKRIKRLRIKGIISKGQKLEVYLSHDNSEFELVGTILGDGSYVDYTQLYTIGYNGIGTSIIGGESDLLDGAFYIAELKLSNPKFRKRKIKLVATGIGYVSVNLIDDIDIIKFLNKLPSKYRTQQNVSLDGDTINYDYTSLALNDYSFESGLGDFININGTVVSSSEESKLGEKSLKVTYVSGNEAYADYGWSQTALATLLSGKNVIMGCWVWSSVPGIASIGIYDNNGSGFKDNHSSYHTGDSTWQYLTVSRTMRDSLDTALFRLHWFGSSPGSAYFDGVEISYSDVESSTLSGTKATWKEIKIPWKQLLVKWLDI